MFRTIAVATATVVAGIAFSAPAAAGNVAWNVTVGGPGFAVSAGQPGFGVGFAPAPVVVAPSAGARWSGIRVSTGRRGSSPRRWFSARRRSGVPGSSTRPSPRCSSPVAGPGFATAGPVWRPVVAAPRVIVRRPVVVAPVMAPPMRRSWQ